MSNLLLLFLLVPAAFPYSEDSYPFASNSEDVPRYLYVDSRSDKPKDKSREISVRSTLDKNSIRLGRSDLPPLLDVADDDAEEDVARSGRSGGNSFLRFGRGPNDFLRFGRGSSNFMRFGRGGDSFNGVKFARGGNSDFMRFGRGGSSFLRFGRNRAQNFMRFGRARADDGDFTGTRKKRDAGPYKKYDMSFMRFGRNDGGDMDEDDAATDEQYENRKLLQLLTDLDCKLERNNVRCARA